MVTVLFAVLYSATLVGAFTYTTDSQNTLCKVNTSSPSWDRKQDQLREVKQPGDRALVNAYSSPAPHSCLCKAMNVSWEIASWLALNISGKVA